MKEYKDEVIADLTELLRENKDEIKDLNTDALRDLIMNYCFSDTVTGNGSGSYYFNSYKAQETINERGLLFDDYFLGYLHDTDADLTELLAKGAETLDVWARCCVLDYMLTDEELESIRDEALEA